MTRLEIFVAIFKKEKVLSKYKIVCVCVKKI